MTKVKDKENVSETKTMIMGETQISAAQMAIYARTKNPKPNLTSCTIEYLAQLFIDEGKMEGVRGDIAFARMLYLTEFLTKDDDVVAPTVQAKVRINIQRLKIYASEDKLVNPCIHPPLYTERGSIEFIEGFGDEKYGKAINEILSQMAEIETEPANSNDDDTEDLQNTDFLDSKFQEDSLNFLYQAGAMQQEDYDFFKENLDEPVTAGVMICMLRKIYQEVN